MPQNYPPKPHLMNPNMGYMSYPPPQIQINPPPKPYMQPQYNMKPPIGQIPQMNPSQNIPQNIPNIPPNTANIPNIYPNPELQGQRPNILPSNINLKRKKNFTVRESNFLF